MVTVRERLEVLQATVNAAAKMTIGADDAVVLRGAVEDALGVPAPEGDPGVLRDHAGAYTRTATDTASINGDVGQIASRRIPDVWLGVASEKASDVVSAIADDLDATQQTFRRAATVLHDLADGIEKAQHQYAHGLGSLRRASVLLEQLTVALPFGVVLPNLVGWDDQTMVHATSLAQQGVADLLGAIATAEDAGHAATGWFNQLAAGARAAHLTTKNLDTVDKLVLADAGNLRGPMPRGSSSSLILTDNEMSRAGQFLDKLSTSDRNAFDQLLVNSKSSRERAYLVQALAAGHTVKEITHFDALVHEHGDDFWWLNNYLHPIKSRETDEVGTTWAVYYQELKSAKKVGFSQAQQDTCVAMSTVVARAMVDPVYMLQLTTGGHPDNPAYDNADAFHQRLLDETNRVYGDRSVIGRFRGGMTSPDTELAANQEVSPFTGGQYQLHYLATDADRASVLPAIEKAVDQGQPVPVLISGPDGGHEVLIIRHDGDKLEIYNPWGYTTWITAGDFLHGHMNSALRGRANMPTAEFVILPQ